MQPQQNWGGMIVYEVTKTVAVNGQWGGMYQSVVFSVDISSLGFSQTPKLVSVIFVPSNGAVGIPVVDSVTNTEVKMYLVRGTSSSLTGTITFLFKES